MQLRELRQVARQERRSARRLPMNCKARIKVTGSRDTHYGVCRDLSVDGMLIETDYVPRYGQLLEVHVLAPAGATFQPLHALVEVRRCVQVVDGKLYRLGVSIRQIQK